ncbi:MAG: nucleotidyltransferase family protein [Candidatus Dadabacteria bacterium]
MSINSSVHTVRTGTKAMIFAAGLGTRFKPWTDNHPKALALVNGKSLLQRNIEYLQYWGINNVVVNVHHFADEIEHYIKINNGWESSVIVSDEREEVLETGGGLLKARSLLQGSRFLTINVDILTDLNINNLFVHHQKTGSLITLAVSSRKTSRYLLFNNDARLCGWRNTNTGQEKIVIQDEGLSEKAYSGIALFEPAIFDLIPFTGKFSLIDVYLALAPHHKISFFDHTGGRLIDVGKPESVPEAERLFV